MDFLKRNYLLILLIIFYTVLLLSIIDFGIPNIDHPFLYHMDEWHQLMAVRALFKHGSSNVPGAANGPIFFFIMAGIYLIPFYLLRIIDPFVIKSAVTSLSAQQHMFEVLRLNTILFGIGSIVLIWVITKRFFKINPFFTTLFFILNPTWIMLSNYFKYDIALTFFNLLSIFMLCYFSEKPIRKRFFLAAIPIGCALSIKISAMPLIIGYLIGYYLFVNPKKRTYQDIFLGLCCIGITFCLIGIPDIITHAKAYYEFFYSNLVASPNETTNFIIPYPVWLYMPLYIFPIQFGHGLFFLFLGAIAYFAKYFSVRKNTSTHKRELLLFCICITFIVSLIPLKIFAGGNRALVLLPFIAFFSGILLQHIYKIKKKLTIGVIILIFIIQLFETYAWIGIKYGSNPRKEASYWMINHLKPGQTIGIENIPIYQGVPDIVLKEFYTLQQYPKATTHFTYEVIDVKSKNLPNIIIVSNGIFDTTMLKKSPKKVLLERLKKEKYIPIKEFNISLDLYQKIAHPADMFTIGLIPLYPISIYQKQL